ncbi:TetR/AcrR family transcriptional regulator [Pseudonocardia spinosispora]|uniref:TetR/AcrR family transcriptional regulator n=1 Tax=Pseudonocardia spinosispora TaxID=103441 RepID=UPI00056D5DD9|nr:TetR/AcrR family transcriptional regulator [Pseudonocardia spinosispora]
MTAAGGRKTGRKPSLTRRDVARAALEAGAERGLEQVSMPAVAKRLGVSHSTLYGYVHDRDDLLTCAVELAASEHPWPSPDPDWRAMLTAMAEQLWTFVQRHPGMAETMNALPSMPPPAMVEAMLGYAKALHTTGFSSRDSVLAMDMINDLILSTAVAMRQLDEVHDTADGPRSRRELHRTSLAGIAELDSEVMDPSIWTGRGWLDEKLQIMLDGFASRLGHGR